MWVFVEGDTLLNLAQCEKIRLHKTQAHSVEIVAYFSSGQTARLGMVLTMDEAKEELMSLRQGLNKNLQRVR